MTKRLPISPAPGPLEDYAETFDNLFGARAQREGFRHYLEGLLLPTERNKTLTALANTEPCSERSARKRRACSGSSPSPGGIRERLMSAASNSCSQTQRRLPTRTA